MSDEYIRKIKIMISSTRDDLFQYREDASRIIRKVAEEKEKQLQLVEVSMEKETQTGHREYSLDISLNWVNEADWVVVIVGFYYGSIPDDDKKNPEHLSYTEWEYNRSKAENKKIFVFMAGEPGIFSEAYRAKDKEIEKVDLKDWLLTDKQSEEQKEKLKKFRQQLCQSHLEIFRDIVMFRDRLEKTLKNGIDKLPPLIKPIGPKTPLAKLILTVREKIEICIRKVTVIAISKRIHDSLHELLQQFINPLWEEVLSMWKKEATLSDSRKIAILRLLPNATKQEGKMETEIRELNHIGQKQNVLSSEVKKVIEQINQWQKNWTNPDFSPSSGRFDEDLFSFEAAVKCAFKQADENMRTEESNLRESYLNLRVHLEKARIDEGLSCSDHQRLDHEFEKVREKSEKLKHTLTTHHNWQEAYEHLRNLDSFRETPGFRRELKKYRDNYLPRLGDLVDKEVDQDSVEGHEQEETALKDLPTPPSRPRGIQDEACVIYIDEIKKLKKALNILQKDYFEEDYTDDFLQKIEQSMMHMRKLFDASFFCVDKRTLEEVNSAMIWVVALKEWLDRLIDAHFRDVGI